MASKYKSTDFNTYHWVGGYLQRMHRTVVRLNANNAAGQSYKVTNYDSSFPFRVCF